MAEWVLLNLHSGGLMLLFKEPATCRYIDGIVSKKIPAAALSRELPRSPDLKSKYIILRRIMLHFFFEKPHQKKSWTKRDRSLNCSRVTGNRSRNLKFKSAPLSFLMFTRTARTTAHTHTTTSITTTPNCSIKTGLYDCGLFMHYRVH